MAYVRSIVWGLSALGLSACSSAPPTTNPNPPPPQYPGDDITGNKPKQCDTTKPDVCLQSCSKSECYPVSNIGYAERKGATPGNRVPNVRFLAHNNLDTATKTASSGDLTPVQLSDFYDPTGTKFRIIRVVVGALWCGPCNSEADFIVANKIPEAVAADGGVLISALTEGYSSGTPATKLDLETWIGKHALNVSAMLESDNKLGALWLQDAIPENITIDARSMEILAKEAGFSQNILSQMQTWITWTKNNSAQAL